MNDAEAGSAGLLQSSPQRSVRRNSSPTSSSLFDSAGESTINHRHHGQKLINNTTFLQSTRCGRLLFLSACFLGCFKVAPLVYMLRYYIPSEALSIPFALQVLIVISGTFIVPSFLSASSRTVAPLWLVSSVLDAAITTAVLFIAMPFAMKLIDEPDGTTNIYMQWILTCFWAYCILGILSIMVSLGGVIQRLKQPLSIQIGKENSQMEDVILNQQEKYYQGVDLAVRDPNEECCGVFQSRAYDVRWCIVPVLIGALWALYVLVAGVEELIIASQVDPPSYARPGALPPNGRSKSVYEGCDPLVPFACALPFPSSFYTRKDSSSKHTGRRIELRSSVPTTRWQQNAESTTSTLNGRGLSEKDGFSVISPILFALSEEVDESSLVQASNISKSTNIAISSSFLVDARTGELVPHFVDKDYFDPEFGLKNQWPEDERRMLIMQPAQALSFNSTYVVAIVNRVTSATTGRRITPPITGAFASLRDRNHSDPEYDHRRAKEFDIDVWPALKRAGIKRSSASLLLAWSFSTASRKNSLGRFERIRNRALKSTSELGPEHYAITSVEDASSKCGVGGQHIAKTLHGHFMSPNYLVTPGPAATSRFVWRRDGEDFEVQNGESQVNFLIRIPCSVWNESRPVSMVLQYGHGLFGSRKEAENAYLGDMADNYGHIIIATDWKGMSKYDVPMALRIFTKRIGEFSSIPERTQQGWIDNQLFLRLVKGRLAEDAHLTTASGMPLLPNGKNTTVGYYGNSQGSVIGGGYFSSSLDLKRGVLGVPGAPFALILSRSKDFAPYHSAFRLQIWNAIDLRIFLSLLQLLWDASESGGWLSNVVHAERYGYPPKRVLLQAAFGDAQVTTIAAEVMARSFHANTIQPETRHIFNVPERKAPWNVVGAKGGSNSNNAIVEYLYDDAPPVRRDRNTPPTDGMDTHECPRREKRTQRQLDQFLVHGIIMQPCEDGKICESKTCPKGNSNN